MILLCDQSLGIHVAQTLQYPDGRSTSYCYFSHLVGSVLIAKHVLLATGVVVMGLSYMERSLAIATFTSSLHIMGIMCHYVISCHGNISHWLLSFCLRIPDRFLLEATC